MGCLNFLIKKSLFTGLALLLLLTLAAAIAPLTAWASPETDAWSTYPIPEKGGDGGWVLTSDVTIVDDTVDPPLRREQTGVTAITVAFDGTIYAATEEIDGSPLNGYNLFKSTDDGYTWTPLWKIPAGDNPHGEAKVIALILPDWKDADTLYLATRYNIYKSTDGGEHFRSLSHPPSTSGVTPDNSALITSFDVTDDDGTYLILVGTQDADAGDYGGVYYYDESQPFAPWTDLRVGGEDAGTKYDVLSVAFSPNVADDGQVVAVVTDETDTIVTAKIGGANWGATVGDAYLLDFTSASWAADGASLAFPTDYDSDDYGDKYTQYVGINVGGVTGGIYVITGVEAPDNSLADFLFPLVPVHSMAIAGEAFDTTIVAGLTNGSVIYTTRFTANGGGLANTPPSAPPAENTCVALGGFYGSAYIVYAGTSGVNGGFARSVDSGATFARTAFICDDLMTITDIAVSPIYDKDGTVYMITQGHSGNSILWRTTNRGQTWDAVLTEGQLITLASGKTMPVGAFDKVAISPRFKSDTTVFICESGDAPNIWRSTDNGFRFSPLPSKTGTTGTIDSWAILGLKEVLVGDSLGNFYLTTRGGLTWSPVVATGLSSFSSMALSPDYDNDHTILAGGNSGEVYLSTDDGETWEALADTRLEKSTAVAFDPEYTDNKTVYAADYGATGATAGVMRFVIDTSTKWQRIDDTSPTRIEEIGASTSARIRGMVAADDGNGLSTLYVLDPNPVVPREIGTTAAEGGVVRCLNPTDALSPSTDAPLFEVVNTELPFGTELSGLWYTEDSHTLWSIDTAATPMALYTYDDTLTAPLELVSPADGASSGRQASGKVSWQATSSATSYEIWYDIDPGFKQSPTRIYSEVARANITGLESGLTYYWKVRVGQPGASLFMPATTIAIGAPALSRFSATWSFTTTLGGSQWSPFAAPGGIAPLPGATGVPIRPAFQWNPADRATGYELILARDSNFADVVIARVDANSLPTAAWACDTDLEYNTTYYWKVRAVNATSHSQWAAGIFTTEPALPAPPASPPPSPPAPPPATETPVSIWVMLAIVVALIIALLVLIITTRHPY